jgi:hypothetical protein
MTIFQGVILNGTEVINAPTIVGNTVFQTTDQTITFGQPLAAASTRLSQDTTRAQLLLGLGTALGNQLVIGENAWIGHDYDHAAAARPMLYIHGAADPDVSPTHWVSLSHDGTDALLATGAGVIDMQQGWRVWAAGTCRDTYILFLNTTDTSAEGLLSYYNVDAKYGYSIRGRYNYDSFVVAVNDNLGRQMVLTAFANFDKNHDHALQTNPTLFIHSATDPDVNNTQWISMTHDQTNGVITTGKGSVVVNVPLITDQLLAPTGSIASQPGISFNTQTDSGMGADSQNLTLWESGTIGLVLSTGITEFRVPSNFRYAFSSLTTNLAAGDTYISRGTAAGDIGNLILKPITEITEVCGVGLKTKEFNATLNDDATISLPAGTGWGTFMIGDNQEYARVRWTSAGVVTLDEGTANVATADTDAFFCIYDGGGVTVTVKNRLGANLTLRGVIHYS